MDTTQAVSLALVQAVTEFLPISSSAHLILLPELMGWKDQGLAFDVAVHFGTLFAVVFHYRTFLGDMVTGARRSRGFIADDFLRGRQGLLFVAIASVPILPAGYLLADFIEQQLRAPLVIASTTIGFGLLLWFSVWREGRLPMSAVKPLTVTSALLVGLAQALALVPGVSRAGVTITAGLLLGLTRSQSIRFSFILAIPAILAASLHQVIQLDAPPGPETWRLMTLGFAVSFFFALATLRLFLLLVNLVGLGPFVAYRLVLGALLLVLFL